MAASPLPFRVLLFFTVACCLFTLSASFGPSKKLHHQRLNATESVNRQRLDATVNVITPTPLFTDDVFKDIAEQVQEQVQIPMVPSPIVTYCLAQALQRMSHDLSPTLLGRVEEMLDSEETSSVNDDLSQAELESLADQTARELVDKGMIDFPMLDPRQEFEILQKIFRVVFSKLATSDEERRFARTEATQDIAVDLLSSPESRKALVAKINAAVDIPIIGEYQEESMISAAVDMCAATLLSLLPQSLTQLLKGESADSLAEMKEFLILKLNENVDLIFLTEEQEESLIRTLVSILIDTYVDPTAIDLLLTKEEQRVKYEELVVGMQREIELSRSRFKREQANLKSQLKMLQRKLSEVKTC